MDTDQMVLRDILTKLTKLEKTLETSPANYSLTDEWVPREKVKQFFGYGDTQIAALQKSGRIVFAKVGKRIFFQRKSLLETIENHRVN